jgi:hypothetical protein
MTRLITKILMVMLVSLLTSLPVYAAGNKIETKYFSAEIANIRRARTGNVIVTIKFVSKIEDVSNLYIYSDIRQDDEAVACPGNKTVLIDGNGDEHTAHNCLPPYQPAQGGGIQRDTSYTKGMQLHAGAESVFVYKFGLAGTSLESLQNINITIPMRYQYCDRRNPGYYDKRADGNARDDWSGSCLTSLETLSFYDVSAS